MSTEDIWRLLREVFTCLRTLSRLKSIKRIKVILSITSIRGTAHATREGVVTVLAVSQPTEHEQLGALFSAHGNQNWGKKRLSLSAAFHIILIPSQPSPLQASNMLQCKHNWSLACITD